MLAENQIIHMRDLKEKKEKIALQYQVDPEAKGNLLPAPKEPLTMEQGLAHPDPKVRAYFLPQKVALELEKEDPRPYFQVIEEVEAQLETRYNLPHDPLSLSIPSPKRKKFEVSSASIEKLRQQMQDLPYSTFIHTLSLIG